MIFEDGGERSEFSPSNNETSGWSGIFTRSLANTVTYVPIELFIGAVPALLLIVHSGLPAIPGLRSLPIERWAETVEERWVAVLNKLPGQHPADEADVKRFKDTQATKTGQIPRFIRLLRVEAGLFEDTVHCSLEWYDLDKSPKYKAISYAWGSSKLEDTIILNGKKQAVTKSAFSVLMAVRSEWRSRLFWIDALCIDQTDQEDKAQQIPLMRDIYYKAHKVIVWLGPAPGSDGSLALGAIHKLWTIITIHNEFGNPLEITDMPAPVWGLIRQMLLAPWFQRTWIVQEVVLARGSGSHTMIRYGDGSLDWETLSWFIRNIRNYPPVLNKLVRPVPNPGSHILSPIINSAHDPIMTIIRNLEAMQDFSTISIRGAWGISLMYYMTRMFRTECTFHTTESKDRVYSVLGLPDNSTMSSAVSTVDYKGQTDEELFTKVAIHTLHDERIKPPCRIDFLAHAGVSLSSLSPITHQYPSWVPNWNITSTLGFNVPRPFLGLDGFRELIQGHMDFYFCRAIADMKCYGDINWGLEPYGPFHREQMDLLGNRLIKTRKAFYKAGIPASLINKDNAVMEAEPKFEVIYPPISPAGGSAGLPKLKIKGVLADWRPLSLRYGTYYSGPDLPFAFTRTIIGDLSRREVDLKHELGVPVRPALESVVHEVAAYEMLVRGYLGLEGMIEINKQVSDTCGNRVFGVTVGGKMGLFPIGTQADDVVVVFWGSMVPFVLRKVTSTSGYNNSGSYQLVGACYVHGIMDGEELEGLERGECDDFVLV
ncbi:Heterokaryon incompatibility protein (HET) domain containing protein [Naviculisporaceae sp. PSN 640]